jgi:outer membrane protein assembly factor BamB
MSRCRLRRKAAWALHGNQLVVGAPTDSAAGAQVGRAYSFDLRSGTHTSTLDDPTPTGGDLFGGALALNDRWLVVAAPADATSKSQSGQVHVFDAASGTLVRTFDDPTPTRFDLFGDWVAVNVDTLLVGDSHDHTDPMSEGQVHVFDVASGRLEHTLTDPTPSPGGDRFGRPVRLVAGRAFVGAFGDDTAGMNVGQVYEFDAASGAHIRTFDDPHPTGEDFFGTDCDADARWLPVGAPGDDTDALDAGEAWLFDLSRRKPSG